MILSMSEWMIAILGGLVLVLSAVPLRIRINGQVADRQGFGYQLRLDWALGLIGVDKVAGQFMQLSVCGIRVLRRFPGRRWQKRKEKKAGKKKKSSWDIASVLRNHLHTLMRIFDRTAGAAFLEGAVTGRIGLPDPADTAKIALLGRMASLRTPRFKLNVAAEYGEEIIRIDAAVKVTLIFACLALVACRLMLQRQTRMMLRDLRHA